MAAPSARPAGRSTASRGVSSGSSSSSPTACGRSRTSRMATSRLYLASQLAGLEAQRAAVLRLRQRDQRDGLVVVALADRRDGRAHARVGHVVEHAHAGWSRSARRPPGRAAAAPPRCGCASGGNAARASSSAGGARRRIDGDFDAGAQTIDRGVGAILGENSSAGARRAPRRWRQARATAAAPCAAAERRCGSSGACACSGRPLQGLARPARRDACAPATRRAAACRAPASRRTSASLASSSSEQRASGDAVGERRQILLGDALLVADRVALELVDLGDGVGDRLAGSPPRRRDRAPSGSRRRG